METKCVYQIQFILRSGDLEDLDCESPLCLHYMNCIHSITASISRCDDIAYSCDGSRTEEQEFISNYIIPPPVYTSRVTDID